MTLVGRVREAHVLSSGPLERMYWLTVHLLKRCPLSFRVFAHGLHSSFPSGPHQGMSDDLHFAYHKSCLCGTRSRTTGTPGRKQLKKSITTTASRVSSTSYENDSSRSRFTTVDHITGPFGPISRCIVWHHTQCFHNLTHDAPLSARLHTFRYH